MVVGKFGNLFNTLCVHRMPPHITIKFFEYSFILSSLSLGYGRAGRFETNGEGKIHQQLPAQASEWMNRQPKKTWWIRFHQQKMNLPFFHLLWKIKMMRDFPFSSRKKPQIRENRKSDCFTQKKTWKRRKRKTKATSTTNARWGKCE